MGCCRVLLSCFSVLVVAAVVNAQGPCTGDNQCTPSQFCQNGICVAKKGFNSACTGDNQCSSNICCVRSDAYPNCPSTGACASCRFDFTCAVAGIEGNSWCNTNGAPPECRPGSVPSGGQCTKTSVCQSDLYCSVSNVCVARLGKGDSCTQSTQCKPNLFCSIPVSGGAGTCADAIGFNGTCNAFRPCLNYLGCKEDSSPAFCWNLLRPNSNPTRCFSDINCGSNAFCTISDFAEGFCTPKLPTGSFCTRARQCASANCTSGLCSGPATCTSSATCPIVPNVPQACLNGLCQAALSLGSPCDNPGDCASGLCSVSTATPSGNPAGQKYCQGCTETGCTGANPPAYCDLSGAIAVCTTKKVGGSACSTNSQCLGNNCTNFICVGGCLTDRECPTGQACLGFQCSSGGALGDRCVVNTDCQSGLCFQGFCRATCTPNRVPTGCPIGTDCVAYGTPGQTCGGGQVGLTCGACVPQVAPPQPPINPGIPDGYCCLFNSQCSSGICNCGICGYRCFSNFQCPPGLFCAGGFCKAALQLPTGSFCSVSAQCASGNCYCGRCTAQCFNDRQCPLGYYCNAITGSCTAASKPNGLPCVSGFECQSGICNNGFCTARCFSSFDCSAGQVCSSGICVSGNCGPLNPCAPGYVCQNNFCIYTRAPDGSRCSVNNDCQSNLCVANVCQKRCLIASDCALGYTCNYVTGLCEWNRKPVGAVCTFNSECASNFCDQVTRTCSVPCTVQNCPLGYTCDNNSGRCVISTKPDSSRCTFDFECTSGVCNLGFCGRCQVVGCQAPGYTCDITGRCVPGLLPIGGSCAVNSQCQSGYCNFGRCSTPCSPNSCGSGYYCKAGCCLAGCLSNSDCPGGYCLNFQCYAFTSLPNGAPCTGSSQCQSNWCFGGQCRSMAPIGGRCQADWECASGICDCSYSWASYGVCAAPCTPFTPTTCGSNFYCAFEPSRWSKPCCVPSNTRYYGSFSLAETAPLGEAALYAGVSDDIESLESVSLALESSLSELN